MKETYDNPTEERDDVATLVRLAGKRKAVPPERTERVKAAARAEWQRQVSRRSTRRIWAGVGGAALAASLLLLVGIRFFSPGDGPETDAGGVNQIEAISGSVWTAVEGDGTGRRPLAAGDTIVAGTQVTTDERARTAIRMATGHLLRLDTSTVIRLQDDGSVMLGQGAVYVDSGFEAVVAGSLDVQTPFGIVREIGTQFEVRLADDNVRVRLREGVVIVHQGVREHEMQVGTELELKADGSVTRRAITTHDTGWDWIATVTPVPDLEGQTVRSFLEWAARERGWRLSFANERVAGAATRTVLSGTASQMTLEEALDAALLTSRMTYTVEEGVLRVTTKP